jgi:Transglycosylase SLT domain/Sel1 repeat
MMLSRVMCSALRRRVLIAVLFAAPGLAHGLAPGAARAGEPEADFAQGLRFETGDGVPRDLHEARQLYCAAAGNGSVEAAYHLGLLFVTGRGVPRNDPVGAAWLRFAARRGHQEAQAALDRLGGLDPARLTGCVGVAPGTVEAALPPPPVVPERVALKLIAPRQIARLADRIGRKYKIDPVLVLAVIRAESGFESDAVSPRNAQGLMQLMPDTAERFGVKNVMDPVDNITGGTRYLRWLLAYFEGDLPLVPASYNAGEGAVTRYGGVPPYPETLAYVEKIRRYYPAAHHPFDRRALGPG